MSSAGRRTARQRGRQQRIAVVILASIGFHGAVLGGLGLNRFRPPALAIRPTDPVILMDIEPRPRIHGERIRPPRPSVTQSRPAARRDEHRREEDRDHPSPPAPRQAAPPPVDAPPPPTNGPSAAQSNPDLAAAIGRSLRRSSGDCYRLARSGSERAACDQRFGAAAAGAGRITGTGDARRDGEFAREGAQALHQYEARRRALPGGTGVTAPADCVGSNFGTGCAGAHLDPSLAPDSRTNIRSGRDGNRTANVPLTPGAPVARD